MTSRTGLSAEIHEDAAAARPAVRLQRAGRVLGWLTATVVALLMGGGFSWTLGRAAQAPQGQPLPPTEARLIAQQQTLDGRLTADQQAVDQVAGQIQALTSSPSAAPAPAAVMPGIHGMTRAS